MDGPMPLPLPPRWARERRNEPTNEGTFAATKKSNLLKANTSWMGSIFRGPRQLNWQSDHSMDNVEKMRAEGRTDRDPGKKKQGARIIMKEWPTNKKRGEERMRG